MTIITLGCGGLKYFKERRCCKEALNEKMWGVFFPCIRLTWQDGKLFFDQISYEHTVKDNSEQ